MATSERCLTSEELTSLLEGQELRGDRGRLVSHLDICPGCRWVLAQSAQHLNGLPREGERSPVTLVLIITALLVALLAVVQWLVPSGG